MIETGVQLKSIQELFIKHQAHPTSGSLLPRTFFKIVPCLPPSRAIFNPMSLFKLKMRRRLNQYFLPCLALSLYHFTLFVGFRALTTV